MPFTIPNEASAFNQNQAEIDSEDIDILVAGIGGDGVVSGCAVTAQGSPDMTVAVASGVVKVGSTVVTVTSGNVTITTADSTNPRIDLITVNNSGTKTATAGTPASQPVYPAVPANSVVLAAVYVPASDTTIASDQITDKRVLLPSAIQLPEVTTPAAPASGVVLFAQSLAGRKLPRWIGPSGLDTSVAAGHRGDGGDQLRGELDGQRDTGAPDNRRHQRYDLDAPRNVHHDDHGGQPIGRGIHRAGGHSQPRFFLRRTPRHFDVLEHHAGFCGAGGSVRRTGR